MQSFPAAYLTGISILALGLIGCGGQLEPSRIASAQQALEQARARIEARDVAAALPLLDEALAASGSLDPDLYVSGLLYRAQCFALKGQLERAETDLALAEQGAPDAAQWHYTRAILFTEQGKAVQARREFAAARKLDPSLQLPK